MALVFLFPLSHPSLFFFPLFLLLLLVLVSLFLAAVCVGCLHCRPLVVASRSGGCLAAAHVLVPLSRRRPHPATRVTRHHRMNETEKDEDEDDGEYEGEEEEEKQEEEDSGTASA